MNARYDSNRVSIVEGAAGWQWEVIDDSGRRVSDFAATEEEASRDALDCVSRKPDLSQQAWHALSSDLIRVHAATL